MVGMATLRSYLQDRPKADFASKIGVAPSYLSQLLSGRRRPRLDLMLRIQEASDGEVDLNSWTMMAACPAQHGNARVKRKGAPA